MHVSSFISLVAYCSPVLSKMLKKKQKNIMKSRSETNNSLRYLLHLVVIQINTHQRRNMLIFAAYTSSFSMGADSSTVRRCQSREGPHCLLPSSSAKAFSPLWSIRISVSPLMGKGRKRDVLEFCFQTILVRYCSNFFHLPATVMTPSFLTCLGGCKEFFL
jgi:hypothetical protein